MKLESAAAVEKLIASLRLLALTAKCARQMQFAVLRQMARAAKAVPEAEVEASALSKQILLAKANSGL